MFPNIYYDIIKHMNSLVDKLKKVPTAVIIVISIVILYLLFSFYPSVFPNGIWRSKTIRSANRANNKILEAFGANTNIVHGPVSSYYKTFTAESQGKNAIVVGLHYTNWCGYCKRMKPIWEQVKKDLSSPAYSGVKMIENDEQANPTPGIDGYPTILKMQHGKTVKYEGRADYDQLRTFILDASNIVPTYGSV